MACIQSLKNAAPSEIDLAYHAMNQAFELHNAVVSQPPPLPPLSAPYDYPAYVAPHDFPFPVHGPAVPLPVLSVPVSFPRWSGPLVL